MNKLIIMAAIFSAIIASCKKDETPKQTCRIITATRDISGMNSTFNLTYNSEGKLSSVTEGKKTSVYVYGGNTVIVNTTSDGLFYSKRIITLNTNGLASNSRTENDITGADWDNSSYEYNGTEILKTTYTVSAGGAPTIETYKWNGGNIVSLTSGSTTYTLEYFTDKPSQPGDYFYFTELISGYYILKAKNALKSIITGADITNFDYNFDADGKITSFICTGGSSYTQTYQYQCN
jgi:hypothetical protein